MVYFVYILKSTVTDRFYIGQSADLSNRLKEHNAGKVFSTKPFRPWKIHHSEEFATRTLAIKREHYLKSPDGWKELNRLKHINDR